MPVMPEFKMKLMRLPLDRAARFEKWLERRGLSYQRWAEDKVMQELGEVRPDDAPVTLGLEAVEGMGD